MATAGVMDYLTLNDTVGGDNTLNVDLQAGTVSKYQNARLIGIDTLANIENFLGIMAPIHG